MSWSIGSVIVAGAAYGYNQRTDQWSWRIPLALQWIFPVSPSFQILYLRELTRLKPPSWASSSSPPNILGGLFATDAERRLFALSSASVRKLERILNRVACFDRRTIYLRAQPLTSFCSLFSASAPLRLCPNEQCDQLRPGLSRYHHLLRFCRYPRVDLIHHYFRDVLGPSPRFEHRCQSCRLL